MKLSSNGFTLQLQQKMFILTCEFSCVHSWHQNSKEIQQENKILSLQVGISGPNYTRFIENQVTNSMTMVWVYLGTTQMDFNFWTGISWQWLETTFSIALDMCRLPSFSVLADNAIFLSYYTSYMDLLVD